MFCTVQAYNTLSNNYKIGHQIRTLGSFWAASYRQELLLKLVRIKCSN